jgi:hypothetical protein
LPTAQDRLRRTKQDLRDGNDSAQNRPLVANLQEVVAPAGLRHSHGVEQQRLAPVTTSGCDLRSLSHRHLCSHTDSLGICAEGESAAAAGKAVTARKLMLDHARHLGKTPPGDATVARMAPNAHAPWRIASLSVAGLLRSLATTGRPRGYRPRRSPIGGGPHRRQLRRTSTTRRAREGAGGEGRLPRGVPRLRCLHAAAQRQPRGTTVRSKCRQSNDDHLRRLRTDPAPSAARSAKELA